MNSKKEKAAVGMAVPATEKSNNTIVSITDNCGNVNRQCENMTAILASHYVQVAARITYKSGRTKDIDIDCDSGIAAVYDIAGKLAFS